MAHVWAARMKGSRGFSTIVAVKTMLPSLGEDPKFEQMFLAEAAIASRIKHPNVCSILDLGETPSRILFQVMEWIDGESLLAMIGEAERSGARVPFPVAARLALEAAKGLHAAHELTDDAGALIGVVHRDVSPHNILVTSDGHVKIVDFGVAKAVAWSNGQSTNAGQVKGKVHFMAPEQAYCIDDIDRRADIFALGIVLYQLVTGTHPFRAENELATLAKIANPMPVPAAETLAKDCPPKLSAILQRALAKDRDDRYPTMLDMARDLDDLLIELRDTGKDEGVEPYVRALFSEREAKRKAAIKEAIRAADEGAPPRPEEAGTGVPVAISTRPNLAKGSRRSLKTASLITAGALVGALVAVSALREPAPSKPVSASPGDDLPAPAQAPLESLMTPSEGESAAASSASPSSSAPPAAAPSAPATAEPKGNKAAPAKPKSKFRQPGF